MVIGIAQCRTTVFARLRIAKIRCARSTRLWQHYLRLSVPYLVHGLDSASRPLHVPIHAPSPGRFRPTNQFLTAAHIVRPFHLRSALTSFTASRLACSAFARRRSPVPWSMVKEAGVVRVVVYDNVLLPQGVVVAGMPTFPSAMYYSDCILVSKPCVSDRSLQTYQ